MNLRNALINQGNAPADVDEIIESMVEQLDSGLDPDSILFDYGLEPDYVFDLLDEARG